MYRSPSIHWKMFKKAYDDGYAIGAFNVSNMEIVQGITRPARKSHARDPAGQQGRPRLREPHLPRQARLEAAARVLLTLHHARRPRRTSRPASPASAAKLPPSRSAPPQALCKNIEITKKVVSTHASHRRGRGQLGTSPVSRGQVKVAAHGASYASRESEIRLRIA